MFDLHTSAQDAPGRAPGAAPKRGAVQRERAERALRESEACFRSIVEGLSEGVLVTDLRDIVVYANPQVQRIYGYAPEELLGRRTYEVLVVAEERDQLRRRVTERARGISERYEARHLRKDGSRVWVEIGGVPLRNAMGEIVGTVGTVTDITARKQTELRLREAEERFRQFAENVDQVFWIRSVDPLRSVYVSPAYERIWGRSRRSLREESGSFLDAIHPDDRERVRTAVHGENASAFDEEYRVVRPDGSVRWVRDRAFPVRNATGEVYRIAGIAEDITARTLAQEALRESEEQLRQAQKMEAVGRLAGGIAHDFNNMLTTIKGNAQLLLMDLQPGAPMRDDLEEIDLAATRAASLTRQLLAFSRRQVLQPEILDLNAHVAEMEKMLCRVIGEDVELRTRLHPALARVRADPGQIEQVILNLAVNARDAMPRGGKLTLETANVELDAAHARGHPSTVPGPYVMLAVSDTGCGMDPEVRERIWEPFFTTKPQGKGTGLGLSTVYGIVRQSGGSIWVYSEPGHGTVFNVYPPREDPETLDARER